MQEGVSRPPLHPVPATADLQGALKDTQRRIARVLSRLSSIYVRPKFQTVAANLLNRSLRYMYSGELVLQGEPRLRPYHMMHLWDDVKEMHGPVECGGVMHSFSSEGFYTVAIPRLATQLRGADAAMDTAWMGFAAEYHQFFGWLSRAASLAGSGVGFGFRAAMYKGAGNWLSTQGATLAADKLGFRLAGRLLAGASGVGTALIAVDLLYSALSYLYEGGQEKAQTFVGLMTGAMDANPIVLLPLNYKGTPYTAGLTGATGPGSLTTAMEGELSERDGFVNLDFLETIRRFTGETAGPQPN